MPETKVLQETTLQSHLAIDGVLAMRDAIDAEMDFSEGVTLVHATFETPVDLNRLELLRDLAAKVGVRNSNRTEFLDGDESVEVVHAGTLKGADVFMITKMSDKDEIEAIFIGSLSPAQLMPGEEFLKRNQPADEIRRGGRLSKAMRSLFG